MNRKKIAVLASMCVVALFISSGYSNILYGNQYTESNIGYSYLILGKWVTTTQKDFECSGLGNRSHVDTRSSPGNVTLEKAPVWSHWWNYSWQYRMIINITDNSGSNLTNYQIPIILDPKNFNYSKADVNGNDTRFTLYNSSSQNESKLLYWIESWNTSGESKIWVNVTEIPANGTATIYMYYGNLSTSSASNGSATFMFFDDFETGNLNKWTKLIDSVWDIAIDQTYSGSYSLRCSPVSSVEKFIVANDIDESDVILDSWWRVQSSSVDISQGVRCSETTPIEGYEINWEGQWTNAKYVPPGTWTSIDSVAGTIPTNTWFKMSLIINGISMKALKNATQICPATGWTDVGLDYTSGSIYMKAYNVPPGEYWWIDDVRVRKYADPEPTINMGAEESNTTWMDYFGGTAGIGYSINITVSDGDVKLLPSISMEVGEVTLSSTIDKGVTASVTFENTYNNPVIVAYIQTRGGGQSIDVRVKDVTSTGCTIFNQEPDNQGHNPEDIGYIVMEAGAHTLPDGTKAEAETHSTSNVHREHNAFSGDTVSFTQSFTSAPVVLATLNTHNNNDFMSCVVPSTSSTDFTVQQEAGGSGKTAVTETIGWIAVESGKTGTLGGQKYETGSASDGSNDGVDNTEHTITYINSYSSTPIIVVAGNSGNGSDGYWARGSGTHSSTEHGVYAEEDQVGDNERSHIDETFSWWAFENSFSFSYGNGNLTSIAITPSSLASWDKFYANDTVNASQGTNITYKILNATDNSTLCTITSAQANAGYDISSCTSGVSSIKLYAELTTNISISPILHDWNVSWHIGYYGNGYLISCSHDVGNATNYQNISWNGTIPDETALKFQIATNNDSATWNFLGPDGSASTYYNISGTGIWSGHNEDRYIKYKAYFETTNTSKTPVLRDVTITYYGG